MEAEIRYMIKVFLIALGLSCFAVGTGVGTFLAKAWAHSWYPVECCSGNDCDLVTAFTKTSPVMVTTSHGTAELTDETKRLFSKDNKLHACIRGGKLICIFFPDSI